MSRVACSFSVRLAVSTRLSTAEIESALVSHPAVAEAAVVGASDEMTGQAVCAFVILRGAAVPADGDTDAVVQELRAHVGKEIGHSDWILIDQARIDSFADATEDRQFIHVDPQLAAASPFGGTIAHGFLTMSMLSAMAYSALPPIIGTTMSVNYGLNSLRFLAPVRSGQRVRGRFVLKDVSNRAANQWQSTLGVTIEIEGEAKPALVAEWLTLAFVT